MTKIQFLFIRGFTKFGVKASVSGVIEDLKFKISEGSHQNWSFPDSAQLAPGASVAFQSGGQEVLQVVMLHGAAAGGAFYSDKKWGAIAPPALCVQMDFTRTF